MWKPSFLGLALVLVLSGPRPALAQQSDNTSTSIVGHPAEFFFRAVNTLSLSKEQRVKVREIQSEAKSNIKNLLGAVAGQVQSGQVDPEALKSEEQQLNLETNLERLHTILTPEQRAELVTKVKGAMQYRAQQERQPLVDRLGARLNLTGQQRDQIKTSLQQQFPGRTLSEEAGMAKAEFDKVLQAFKGEQFKMDQVIPPQRRQAAIKKMEGVLQTVVPVLTPQQRSTLARDIRTRANRIASLPSPKG